MSWASDFKLFLKAAPEIRSRSVRLKYSYLLVSGDGVPVAISPGDFCFPAEGYGQAIRSSLISLEDSRFDGHFGIDLKGIVRALFASMMSLSLSQGGSTITQQFVRVKYLHGRKNISRKFFEIVLSVLLEKKYSKDEILSFYMDCIYMGPGVRGFQAASFTSFRRPLKKINQAEGLALIGLVNKPMIYSPLVSEEKFVARHRVIAGFLKEEASDIGASRYFPTRRASSIQFTSDKIVSNTFPVQEPIKRVVVSVSSSVQRALDGAVRDISVADHGREIGFIVASLKDCSVIAESAWENGKAKQDGFNFFRKIQPGSTFKTFALLEALNQGASLEDLYDSSPYDGRLRGEHGSWVVRNPNDHYCGDSSLLSAFSRSDNTVFARLSEQIDISKFYDGLKDFSLMNASDRGHRSLVLGATKSGVSLASLVAAYAAIANDGVFSELQLIRSVERYSGEVSLSSNSGVLLRYHGSAISNVKIALRNSGITYAGKRYSGKTGTTSFGTSYVGYDDDFVYGLWMGKPYAAGFIDKGHVAKSGFIHIVRAISSALLGRGLRSI